MDYYEKLKEEIPYVSINTITHGGRSLHLAGKTVEELGSTEKVDSTIKEKETISDETQITLSPEHKQIIELANEIQIAVNVDQWSNWDIIKWIMSKGDKVLFDLKKQWIKAYSNVIKAAAEKNDLPAYLVAGVCYIEVGGDPLWIDDFAYNIRKIIPTGKDADLTSFGNVSMQIRTAAATLGYDFSELTDLQRKLIINFLKDPVQNIFVAAKHLSDLRNIDFEGLGSKQLTVDQVKVIATRYNRGSLSLQSIKENMSYGEFIIKRKTMLEELLE